MLDEVTAIESIKIHHVNIAYVLADMPARYAVERRHWDQAAAITLPRRDALAAMSGTAHLVQMFELHRGARPCFGSRRERGQNDQALGRSRGGFSTKIHLKVDFDGLPLAFHLTGGEASDSRNFEVLLDLGPDIAPRAAITDKGYDAKADRDGVRRRGICPVIPFKSNAIDKPAFFPKILYKARARIEQAVGKLKRFKRIALRCEKTAQNYRSFVALAFGFILIKSVHTALAFT